MSSSEFVESSKIGVNSLIIAQLHCTRVYILLLIY